MDLADGMIPIAEHFGELEDPRRGRAKRHELLDIIVITLCAVVCGADNWVEIEEFGKAKREWFERFLKLPNGIPSHDTFGRVFGMLDSERFAACFTQWVQSVSQLAQGEVVAIDGKTLRGCHDRDNGRGTLHLVSAWATENRMVLGQVRTGAHSSAVQWKSMRPACRGGVSRHLRNCHRRGFWWPGRIS